MLATLDLTLSEKLKHQVKPFDDFEFYFFMKFKNPKLV
jgi:hypothetical protein